MKKTELEIYMKRCGELRDEVSRLRKVEMAAKKLVVCSWNDMPAIDDRIEDLIEALNLEN